MPDSCYLSGPEHGETLAGAPRLRLRVILPDDVPQILELTDPRVTFGSTASCTVCLPSGDVRPLHCLAVRSLDGYTVRSLARDTWLNGRPFREQSLRIGDLLKLGSVQIEILAHSDESPSPLAHLDSDLESRSAVAPVRESSQPVPMSAASATHADELLVRMDRLEQQLHDEWTTPPSASPVADAPVEGSGADFADPPRLSEIADRLESLCETLDRRLCETEPGREIAPTPQLTAGECAASQDSLPSRETRREWELLLQQFQTERTRWETRQEQWHETQQQLIATHTARCQELETTVARLQDQCERLCEQMTETRLCEARTQVSGGARAEPAGPAVSPAAFAPAAPERSPNPSPSSAPTPTASSELRRNELQWLARQWGAAKPESESLIPATHQPVSNQPESAGASERDLPSPETASSIAASADLDSSPLGPHGTPAFGTAPSVPESRRTGSDVASQPNVQPISMSNPPETPPTECSASSVPAIPSPTDDFIPLGVTEEQAEQDGEVFERLRRAGIWRTRQDETVAADPDTGDSVIVDSPLATSTAETNELASLTDDPGQLAVAKPREDDDSIEAYMQRLLERVRGSSGPSPGSVLWETLADQQQLLDAELSPELPEEDIEPSPLRADEYLPRRQAPELNANLAAMREIANDERRSNMMSHARRTWTAKSKGQILGIGGGIALAAGSAWFLEAHIIPAAIGITCGIVVVLVGAWQTFSIRRRLVDSLKLDLPSAD